MNMATIPEYAFIILTSKSPFFSLANLYFKEGL